MSNMTPQLLLVSADSVVPTLLAAESCVLTQALQLSTGLEKLQRGGYDLILLDLRLPDAGGIEALNQVQTLVPSKPVIVLAEPDREEEAASTISLGAQDYLLKPDLTRKILMTAIFKALDRQSRQVLHPQEGFLLHTLMEKIPDHVYFKDINSRYLMVSLAKAKMHGQTDPAEIVGKTDADFYSPEHAEKTLVDEVEIMCSGRSIEGLEECIKWPDGRVTWSSTTKMALMNPFGEIVGTFGISRDITAQKQAAKALANERALLRSLVDNLPICVYLKDRDARKTLSNPIDLRNFGLTKESDLLGKTDFDFFPPEQAAAFYADDQQVLQTGKPVIDHEEKLTTPGTNQTRWNLSSKVPVRDSDGHITGIAGFALDITDHKNALRELANERAVLRLLVDSLPVSVYLKDKDGRKTLANKMELRFCGCQSESEVLGKTDFDVFPGDQAAGFYADEQKILKYGIPLLNHEEKITLPDGSTAWLLTSKVPLRDAEGNITGLAGIGLDITERKIAEQKLAQKG